MRLEKKYEKREYPSLQAIKDYRINFIIDKLLIIRNLPNNILVMLTYLHPYSYTRVTIKLVST